MAGEKELFSRVDRAASNCCGISPAVQSQEGRNISGNREKKITFAAILINITTHSQEELARHQTRLESHTVVVGCSIPLIDDQKASVRFLIVQRNFGENALLCKTSNSFPCESLKKESHRTLKKRDHVVSRCR